MKAKKLLSLLLALAMVFALPPVAPMMSRKRAKR